MLGYSVFTVLVLPYCLTASLHIEQISVEISLLRVQNDILLALDVHRSIVLVLLDLLAATDTVSHQIQNFELQAQLAGLSTSEPGLQMHVLYSQGKKKSLVSSV